MRGIPSPLAGEGQGEAVGLGSIRGRRILCGIVWLNPVDNNAFLIVRFTSVSDNGYIDNALIIVNAVNYPILTNPDSPQA